MTFTNQLYLDAPVVGQLEKDYLCKAIDSGFVSTIGPFVPEFETKFGGYLGVTKAVSVQSGTAALHISLVELGIGAGDEVIVPDLTFIATVNPIIYVGATPVIVEVEPDTWNISPEAIRKAITSKTRAIMPVHLYGNPCNMEEIMQIAREYKLYVIEDATESLGATYKDRYTGTFGDLGAFSFNGNKTMTTGGGGMVVGNNIEKLAHIKYLVNQARDESRGYYHTEVGYNYRLTNLEAAMGLAQLEQFVKFLAIKRHLHNIYEQELSGIAKLSFQKSYPESRSSYWFTAVCFQEAPDISMLQQKLKEKGLPSRRNFVPLHQMPAYSQFANENYPNAERLYNTGLCLPSSCLNTEEAVRDFCKVLREI